VGTLLFSNDRLVPIFDQQHQHKESCWYGNPPTPRVTGKYDREPALNGKDSYDGSEQHQPIWSKRPAQNRNRR
jgi:hypothetical protein